MQVRRQKVSFPYQTCSEYEASHVLPQGLGVHGSVAIVPATRSWPECDSALHQTSKAQVFTEVHVTRPIQESHEHGVDYVTVALSIRFEVSDLPGVAVVARSDAHARRDRLYDPNDRSRTPQHESCVLVDHFFP